MFDEAKGWQGLGKVLTDKLSQRLPLVIRNCVSEDVKSLDSLVREAGTDKVSTFVLLASHDPVTPDISPTLLQVTVRIVPPTQKDNRKSSLEAVFAKNPGDQSWMESVPAKDFFRSLQSNNPLSKLIGAIFLAPS